MAIVIIVLLLLFIIIKSLIIWLFFIKIYILFLLFVCLIKLLTKVALLSVKFFVLLSWMPPAPPSSGPVCPAPTLWSIIKNSLPAMGVPNAKKNFKEKIGNFEDLISFQMSKMANKMHRII